MTIAAKKDLTTERLVAPGRRRHGVVAQRTKTLGDAHLFTASEISLALEISRDEFFSFSPTSASQGERGYGIVLLFDAKALPEDLRSRFAQVAKTFRHSSQSIETTVRMKLQIIRRAGFAGLLDQTLSPRWKAYATAKALALYFCGVDNAMPQWRAAREAGAEFVRLTGESRTERQIRRISDRVDSLGGPALAPIDAYADLKSVPHKRGKNHRPPHGAKPEGGTNGD